jgi:hypothetical protein
MLLGRVTAATAAASLKQQQVHSLQPWGVAETLLERGGVRWRWWTNRDTGVLVMCVCSMHGWLWLTLAQIEKSHIIPARYPKKAIQVGEAYARRTWHSSSNLALQHQHQLQNSKKKVSHFFV